MAILGGKSHSSSPVGSQKRRSDLEEARKLEEATGEEALEPERTSVREKTFQRRRALWGPIFRVILAIAFVPIAFLLHPSWLFVLVVNGSYVLLSLIGVVLARGERAETARVVLLLTADIALISVPVWGHGAETSPFAFLYLCPTFAITASRGPRYGLLSLILSLVAFLTILVLTHASILSVAPFLDNPPPPGVSIGPGQTFFVVASSVTGSFLFVAFVFVRVQRHAEAEREAREHSEQLQLQLDEVARLESIGRLAGGIAHDFNNLLTAILGYTNFAKESVEPDSLAADDLSQVIVAAQQARNLTGKLLAFSRKQVVKAQILDLNRLLMSVGGMLERIIGEDIELRFVPGEGLWFAKVDPGHIEQITMNLVVNARDAMPKGGTLSIETRNVTVERADETGGPVVPPGDYVMLLVNDTGMGMEQEMLEKIFEPFFTTKPKGKGTGLGLASVYGMVRQNAGHIHVESAVGVGTTFRIYWPRAAGNHRSTHPPIDERPTGQETILLVEDELMVRRMAKRILIHSGYSVIDAPGGEEALRRAIEHDGKIDALLTDVIMPGLSGREVADHFEQLYPESKILFMSGYTADVIGKHGVLEKDTAFLQKPFDAEVLLVAIRKVLDTNR